MRPVFSILIIVLVGFTSFAQEDDRAAFRELNTKVVNALRANAFQAAEELSTQLVSLSIKLNGAASRDTAIATMNLALAQKQQKKYAKAMGNFEKAVRILEEVPERKLNDLVGAYESLARTCYDAGKSKEAIAWYEKAVSEAEQVFGVKSKEAFSLDFNLAMLYAARSEYEKSATFYSKAMDIAVALYGWNSSEVDKVMGSRLCSGINDHLSQKSSTKESTDRSGQVLNGKAISLPKPFYPARARKEHRHGKVYVRVGIDETGTVMWARAICGDDVLGEEAEDAAREAKFTPTLLEGKPIKVSGMIVYDFIK